MAQAQSSKSLLDWLIFAATIVSMVIIAGIAYGRLEGSVQEQKEKTDKVLESDAKQWQFLRDMNNGVREIQFNQRRDLEDRGKRYISLGDVK